MKRVKKKKKKRKSERNNHADKVSEGQGGHVSGVGGSSCVLKEGAAHGKPIEDHGLRDTHTGAAHY